MVSGEQSAQIGSGARLARNYNVRRNTMKKTFTRIIATLLAALSVAACIPAEVMAAPNYTCSSYTDCTKDGGKIFVITKDNCPIREKANNSGKIVARAKKGQLISVSRVFWTAKCTRWCEIKVSNSSKKYYIYTGNCEEHTTHSYVDVMANDKGYITFCTVCGHAKATTGSSTATCDLKCVGDQALKGSFSEYEQANFASVAAQVAVGEIPVVGTIADVRDIIGDIMTGQPAWVVALDCVALVPLVGAVKYADNLDKLKYVDNISDVAKKADDIPWGMWSDYKKVKIGGKQYAKIGNYNYSKHAVDSFLNPSVETNQIRKIDSVTGKISYVEHSRGIPPSYVNWVLTEGVANGTTKASKPYVVNGAKRVKYTNGSLSVVVESGNIVVSIFSE